jgi:predicted GH43/DUF377 family glycosyl hydrolase
LLATGPDIEHLEKRGIALASKPRCENPKEATIAPVADGTWRLFFEYAVAGASNIGIASAPAVDGPWTVLHSLFDTRENQWDSWHLSTGPVLTTDARRPVMFYNGATKLANWRIGWVIFNENYTRILARCDEPLITLSPRKTGDTAIGFAASALEQQNVIHLY